MLKTKRMGRTFTRKLQFGNFHLNMTQSKKKITIAPILLLPMQTTDSQDNLNISDNPSQLRSSKSKQDWIKERTKCYIKNSADLSKKKSIMR